ncbi:MAG: redoxin domain-containing protein [Rhodospirillaceae bacterium]|nr:redoxin domain-containing protein [Rhodospirillaceae bacterium]MBT5195166.1 redoxin domain-containing protein [Rhodospirillaceae bacterium]
MSTQQAAPQEFVFEIGDRVPDFALPDPNGALTGLLTHSRGKRMVYIICAEGCDEQLAPFIARHGSGTYDDADVFAITRRKSYDNGMMAERLQIHFGVLSDEKGAVSRALARADLDPGIPPAVATLVIGTSLRLEAVFRDGDGDTQAAALAETLAAGSKRPAAAELFRPAPVLVVPGVLDRPLCRQLRDYIDNGPARMGGTFDNTSGANNQINASSKVRRDLPLSDPALQNEITGYLIRRLMPDIKRAYDFDVAGADNFKIGRYDGSEAGHFRPHRDNIVPELAWRRFAMSLLLNDASEYDGGGLRFAEYSDHIYGANEGDAVIFSCSMLHEVMEVTRGSRYILLTFLYGREEQLAMQRGELKGP